MIEATVSAAPAQAGRRALLLAVNTAVVLVLFQYVTLFPFVIDDAYIVLRYARNLVTTGQLVFNPGEHVSALTSPLHALITAAIYAFAGEDTLLVYKIICCACVGIGAWRIARTDADATRGRIVALITLVAAPSVVLWTFGGLETPLLFLVVALFSSKIVRELRSAETLNSASIVELHLLAAVAFLLRHDSVCFFAPALLMCWRHRRDWRSVGLAVAIAALPCVGWFAFAWDYYGDLLPTSFYVKTPAFTLRGGVMNGIYELLWLTLMGITPLLVAALIARLRRGDRTIERPEAILLVALGTVLVYGLSMAQKHMMFGFRHGMPYLPAATAIILIELRRWSLPTARLATILLAVVFANAIHTQRVLDVSVNGYWRSTEYGEADARVLMRMVGVWKGSAQDIHEHWQSVGAKRAPRVFTYAGGVMPYALPEAYIFEELVSARRSRCANATEITAAADYVHATSPSPLRASRYYSWLAGNPALKRISDRTIDVDGELRHVEVYYNSSPTALALPSRFDEPCPAATRPASQQSYFYQRDKLVQTPDPFDKMLPREQLWATERPTLDRDINGQAFSACCAFVDSARRPAGAAAGIRVHRPQHRWNDLPDPRSDPGDDHVGMAVPEGSHQGGLVSPQADDLPGAQRAAGGQPRRLASSFPAQIGAPQAACTLANADPFGGSA